MPNKVKMVMQSIKEHFPSQRVGACQILPTVQYKENIVGPVKAWALQLLIEDNGYISAALNVSSSSFKDN